jgi:hypothetical protein
MGGRSYQDTANNNQVFLYNSTVKGTVWGNYARQGSATGSQIFLYGNSTAGKIIGAETSNDGKNSQIFLYDSSGVTGDIDGGGTQNTNHDRFTGNTLYINRSSEKAFEVTGVYSFQFLNFTLPGDIKAINDANPSAPLLTANTLNYTQNCSGGCSNNNVTLDLRTPGSSLLNENTLVGTYALIASPTSQSSGGGVHLQLFPLRPET